MRTHHTIKGTLMNAKQTAFALVWIASVISLMTEATKLAKRLHAKKNSK